MPLLALLLKCVETMVVKYYFCIKYIASTWKFCYWPICEILSFHQPPIFVDLNCKIHPYQANRESHISYIIARIFMRPHAYIVVSYSLYLWDHMRWHALYIYEITCYIIIMKSHAIYYEITWDHMLYIFMRSHAYIVASYFFTDHSLY